MNHERVCWIKAKRYSYLKDNKDEDKKARCTEKCAIKEQLKFEV